MTKKKSKLSSKKHNRSPAVRTQIPSQPPSTINDSARSQSQSVLNSASAAIGSSKRKRIHLHNEAQKNSRITTSDRRTERYGKRKASFQFQSGVAQLGVLCRPGRKKGGGRHNGSKRSRADSVGMSKSTIHRWDQRLLQGYYEQDPSFLLRDQRGGRNRRFSDFIGSLVFEFVVNRAENHVATRPIDATLCNSKARFRESARDILREFRI